MNDPKRSIEEMWQDLQKLVLDVRDPWIRALLDGILQRHGARLRTWPAAAVVHHAYPGGLLDHILQIAAIGREVALSYGVDPDLVISGAILHDIGKIEELHTGDATTYSRRGNLLGHITIGVTMVHAIAARIDGFPEGLLTRIEHMIVSHHGARALGSPVEPMTEEALILNAIDDLDATLHQFRRHVAEDAGGGEFTAYHPRLRRVLLKPSGR